MPVSLALALLAAPAAPSAQLPPSVELPPDITMREVFRPGPTPGENIYLRPGHKNSDDRMFPDIAIGSVRVDGDTLYVKVENKGTVSAQTPLLVAARAEAGGVKSGLAEVRTPRLASGESRWVAIKGFSVKSAGAPTPAFALANATTVSAVVRLLPSSGRALDRSGQGCGDCTVDADESNNVVTAAGAAIEHGRPQ